MRCWQSTGQESRLGHQALDAILAPFKDKPQNIYPLYRR
jgi:hypothetical protein